MIKNQDLKTLINDFLEYLEIERNVSRLTVRNYHHYLNRFLQFLKTSLACPTLKDVNQESVRNYRLFLSRFNDNKGKPLKKVTQGYHVIALRSFLRWLAKNDFKAYSADKIEVPKPEPRPLKFLDANKVLRLLNQPTLDKTIGLRDKAILEVLFSTGLRVSELISLNKEQINLKTREVGVIGKGGKSRVVFLSKRASHWLDRYLAARDDHYQPLFIRYSGKKNPAAGDEEMRLTCRSVQRMIKKYARKAELPIKVTPHILRHSFATDLLFDGADLRSVQELLGHKNIATTQIYTHVTNQRLREIHDKFHSGNK